jgi:hypothetical protein
VSVLALKFTLLFDAFITSFGVFYRPYFLLIPIIAVGMYGISFIQFKNKTITTLFYGLCIAFFFL